MHFRKTTWVLMILLALLVLALWFLQRQGFDGLYNNEGETPRVTRTVITKFVAIPEPGSTSPASIAVPEFTGPAGPNTNAQFRSFILTAKNGEFSPSTVVVRQNDVVHLRITALDGDHDFTQPDYGFSMLIPSGSTKLIEFNATAPGVFTFYCRVCENTNKEGKIIVNAL